MQAPLFQGLHVLAVDDGRTRASFSSSPLARLHEQGVLQANHGAAPFPELQVPVYRAPWWRILWQGPPLAEGIASAIMLTTL